MFIRAASAISPQPSFGVAMLEAPVEYHVNRLSCIEPEYREFIDPKMIRRMSRIIKMGVAAASRCLQNAGVSIPDAIVTGTAYGCLDDTGVFLNRMIEFNEEMLNPTSFIQSTHNTVGAQIALSVKCHGYNNTYVHRGFSFESALLDGILLLKDKEVGNVLIGAADEITDISFAILSRFNIYREGDVSNLMLTESPGKGTIAGEGSAFFLLSDQASPENLASLDANHTFYKPGGIDDTINEVKDFLDNQSLSPGDIDLVINGKNGDSNNDEIYNAVSAALLAGVRQQSYKHLCGEYPTSSAFAIWYATSLLGSAKRILIYNHYKNTHHSLILVSAC
jgi:3-oxoacyl-(acyl-carrier-protein) synthase